MTKQTHTHRTRRLSPLARCLPWAVAALTFGAAAGAQAGGLYDGEGAALHGAAPTPQVVHLSPPSSSVAVEPTASLGDVGTSSTAAGSGSAAVESAPSRSEVRQSGKRWRQASIATPSNEIGDTAEVLQARQEFYELQTSVREAEYAAAAEREQEAHAAAQQALAADELMAEAGSDWVLADALASNDTPAEEPLDEREIFVRPEMTIGELMSYLEDSPPASEVTVLMVSAEDDSDD